MNAAMLTRLRFIDLVLDYYGIINRALIVDFYGLSTAQASIDIQHYLQEAPDNMAYDMTAKCYRITATFKRKYP